MSADRIHPMDCPCCTVRVVPVRRIIVGAAGLILVVPALLLGVWVALPA